MSISKNRGIPKWMVYNGKPYKNGWFGGTTILGNIHIYTHRPPLPSATIQSPRYVWPPSLVLRWWRAARSVSRRPSGIPRVANSIHPRSHLSCQHPKSGNCSVFPKKTWWMWWFNVFSMGSKKKHGIFLRIFWHQKWIESSTNGLGAGGLGVDWWCWISSINRTSHGLIESGMGGWPGHTSSPSFCGTREKKLWLCP